MTNQILDPAILSSIAHLEVVARQAVEGAVSGMHRSHMMGRNVEFSEYRPYNPGDELRLVDWRVYAKTDRYHIKQFEEDTNLRALILADLSGSMWFGEPVSKALYVQQLAAALSYLMVFQGDSVGLCTFDENIREYVPPRNRTDQWGVVLGALAQVQANRSTTRLGDVLAGVREYLKKRGLLIIISDLIDDPEQVLASLSVLGRMKQEILLFHVLSHEELDLPYSGTVEFHNIEGDEDDSLRTAPKRLRDRYQQKVHDFVQQYRNRCLEQGIDYKLVRTDQPLDQVLRDTLHKRRL